VSALIAFFNVILYRPLVNLLVLLYAYFPGHDLGLAVILLTIIVKLILSPVSLKSARSQKALSAIQPKIKELQNKYKNDKLKQSQALMELYKKEKISPLSGCLPLLLQLPILIALYQVFLKGLKPGALNTALYGFVPHLSAINPTFFGIIALDKPNFILAVIAGVLQFFQSKISLSSNKPKQSPKNLTSGKKGKGDFAGMMQNQMLYFFPLLTVFLVWKFGAIIGLYWITITLFSIGEYYIISKPKKGEGKEGQKNMDKKREKIIKKTIRNPIKKTTKPLKRDSR